MARQKFTLVTNGSVRIEFHVTEDANGLELTSLFNPARAPDTARFINVDEVADAMEARVTLHLLDHATRLRIIRTMHDSAPITLEHLGRYAVPVIAGDDGRRE